MAYKTKEELEKINFTNRSKKELSKINSVSGKKSEGAKKRWFRHNNPDIDALMKFYKNGNQNDVMEKYIADNERFMDLFKNATTTEMKRKILRDYQTFQLKIYELMFGSKVKTENKNYNYDIATLVFERIKEYKKQQQRKVVVIEEKKEDNEDE